MSKLIPKYQKGKPVKYFGAYNPKQQAYVLPVYKKEGVVLPEITVTPKNNTDLGGYMQNRDFGLWKEIASYTPAGDVMDATQIYKDTKQGNYGQAALGAGLFFLPNVIERPLKKVRKWFGKKFFPKNSNYDWDEIIKSIQIERKLKQDREFELGRLDRVLGKKSNNEYVQEIYGDRWKNAFDLAQKRGYLQGYTLDDVRDALTQESRGYFGGVPFKHQNNAEMIQVNGNWGNNTPFAYATNNNGRETVFINSDKMYKKGITDDELDTGLHEVAHANTLRIEPGETNEIAEAILSSVLKEQDPIRYKREKIIKDVMKYNKDISDVVDEGTVVNPRTGDLYINDIDNKDMDSYLRQIQEMRSRALSINSNAKRNNTTLDKIIDNANIDGNLAEIQAAQLKAASKNPKKFTREVLGLIPLLGFYGVNRENDKKYKNGGLIHRKGFIRND